VSDAKLYVIPGSHACRAGILMLEHKGIAYRRVELLTGAHPFIVRALGFPGQREVMRDVDGKVHASLKLINSMGTVPALLAYRRDLRGQIEARPSGALMERVLPMPAT
jgi:hypothetical protein